MPAIIKHGLSFDIEEHFQVAAFDCVARRRHWGSLESRVERNTNLILDFLQVHGIYATMFLLGWVAERHKGLVRRIVEEGHELASHGYAHELITGQTPPVFREDIRRAKHILEDIGGRSILGYRAPTFSITKETEWALPILVEEGYRYDSSIMAVVHDTYGIPGATPTIHQISTESGPIWEVPPSTCKWAGLTIPVAGGGYFRLFPYWLFKRLLRRVESQGRPLVMYLHPWELDPYQPRMRGSTLSKFRHYLNLHKVPSRLQQLLKDFAFGPIYHLLPLRSPNANETPLPSMNDEAVFPHAYDQVGQ
jgi:polysaccharide deacetylase family protein (PEP-CTERM system associated)